MKKYALLLLTTAIISPSFAADNLPTLPGLITKAASDPCTVGTAATPLSCSGGYIGGGIGGEGSNANIIGSGINGSVFAGGMTPTLDFGYQYAKSNWFFAGEFDAAYAVGSNSTVNGSGNNINGIRLTEMIKVGGNLSGLLGVQTPITIPASLQQAILAPYVHVGQTQWQLAGGWANGTTSGAGITFDIGPKWFGDLRYTYTSFNGAQAGGLTVNNDQSLLVTFNYKLN
jgi:opacity protein-like surface antigen